MKTIRLAGIMMISSLLVFTNSCEKMEQEGKGKVTFSMNLQDGHLKSATDESVPPYYSWHILLSITDVNGVIIMDNELIPLISFGDQFITSEIEMKSGRYSLTKFMVIGPEGNVVYASPMEGSSKAFLVDDPLPLSFAVRPGDVTKVVPQVLPAEGSRPSDFGYAAFGFEVVEPVIAYVMVVDDNPLLERPSSMLPATMKIITPEGIMIDYRLEARVNRILIKPGYDMYHVVVENPNYPPIKMEVSARAFFNTSPENPYVFRFNSRPISTLILQPGPEVGKDAMITDLNNNENFGNYEYFEASFLTEPILTVMRTRRSLIYFNPREVLPEWTRIEKVTLVLQFEAPIWDSLYQSQLDDFMLWDGKLVFQQIIEPWEESEVTWENQPQTIEANQVFVTLHPELSTSVRSYDVTSLFVPVQEIAAPNYGIMFRHPYSDNPSPGGLRFASSDYPIEEMRPKLIVEYSYLED